MQPKHYIDECNSFLNTGNVNEAYLLIQKALTLYPNNNNIKERFAKILFRKGELEESAKLYSQLVNKHPSLLTGYIGLIHILFQQNKINEIEDYIITASSYFPDNVSLKNIFIHYNLRINDVDKACYLAKELIKDNPNVLVGYLKLSQILLKQNKLSETREILLKALKLFPHNLIANERIAILKVIEGDFNGATAIYKKLIQDYPNSSLGYIGLSQVLLKQNKLEEAERIIESIKIKFPKQNSSVHFDQLISVASKDIFPTRTTRKKDLLEIISKLHPIICDKQLIRVGTRYGDGGYLLPDDLDGIEACFSPGVGPEALFEHECANLGMKIFLADKSVEQPILKHSLFHFIQKYIGVVNDSDTMTINDWVLRSLPSNDKSDLLLQMDIEGDEYSVLLATPQEILNRFRIIIVEFHWLENLWSLTFYGLFKDIINKLLINHSCLHIHPNNNVNIFKWQGIDIPSVIEVTFLRNDRVNKLGDRTEFPHSLDFRNNPFINDIILPKQWYATQ